MTTMMPMTARATHREWLELRAYLKHRQLANDTETLAKFVADEADPSDPDHAAAIRAAYRALESELLRAVCSR
jgi:hypothetical protein